MTGAEITIHNASRIRVESHTPTNNNYIGLEIEHDDGRGVLKVCLFGLPEHATQKLMLAFSDIDTVMGRESE